MGHIEHFGAVGRAGICIHDFLGRGHNFSKQEFKAINNLSIQSIFLPSRNDLYINDGQFKVIKIPTTKLQQIQNL